MLTLRALAVRDAVDAALAGDETGRGSGATAWARGGAVAAAGAVAGAPGGREATAS
jgi:hypothetical protein